MHILANERPLVPFGRKAVDMRTSETTSAASGHPCPPIATPSANALVATFTPPVGTSTQDRYSTVVEATVRALVVTTLAAGALVAGAAPSSHAASNKDFDWPLQPRPSVERAFDKPTQRWLPGHRGVDLAGSPGQAVLAAGPGIVVFAGKVADKPTVSIEHEGGLRTSYEPVEAIVPVGRRVERGTKIGTLLEGHPGCPSTTCLHWGLRRGNGGHSMREYLNPLGLLRTVPVRLKPVATGVSNAPLSRGTWQHCGGGPTEMMIELCTPQTPLTPTSLTPRWAQPGMPCPMERGTWSNDARSGTGGHCSTAPQPRSSVSASNAEPGSCTT